MEFRTINKNDFEACAKLLIKTFGEEPWNEIWTYQQAFERIDELMASRMSRGYVVIENGEIAGMCIGRIMTYMDFKEFFIDEFSISPKIQGRGAGSGLIKHAIAETAKENVANLSLTTERGYPAVKFYEKNGFKIKESIVFMHN